MEKNHKWILGGVFFFFFLILTPLGLFGKWIPPVLHTGFYSVTQIDPGDDTGYYAFLRSGFFDGDWDFINEPNYAHAEQFNSTGYVFTFWQVGQSILYVPFFLLGHLLALALNSWGYVFELNGNSPPYHIATAIASQTYVFIGLILLFRILRRFYSGSTSLVATLGVWLGSSLLYYTFIRQRMAHGTEFCFSVVFLLTWLRFRKSKIVWEHALIGGALGFLCLIRLINVGYMGLYVADMVWIWFSTRQNERALKEALLKMTAFGIASLVMFSPQLYTWNQIDGSLLNYVAKVFEIMGGQVQSSSEPGNKFFVKAWQIFIGPQWSLALATPLCFLGFLGLIAGQSRLGEVWLPLVVGLSGFFFLNFGTLPSVAYGNRSLIPATALFAIGLGILIEWTRGRRGLFVLSSGIVAGGVMVQYVLLIHYKTLLVYNDSQFAFKALAGIPSLLKDYSHLLLRSTNWFRIFFVERTSPWTVHDFLMMIVLPLGQLVSVVAVLAFVGKEGKKTRGEGTSRLVTVLAALGTGVLACLVTVGIMAPDKTKQEIEKRTEFTKIKIDAIDAEVAGNYSRAIKFYQRASKLLPDSSQINFNIAINYDNQGKFLDANKYYLKVLNRYPNHYDTLYGLGKNLIALGDVNDAEVYLLKARRMEPRNPEIFDSLGQVYVKTQRYELAENMFRTAVGINPKYGAAQVNLAKIYATFNYHEEAMIHLKAARDLGEKGPLIEKLVRFYKLK